MSTDDTNTTDTRTLKAGSSVTVDGAPLTLCADVEAQSVPPPAQYPKLLWDKDGREITVQHPAEEAEKLATGHTETNPLAPLPEPSVAPAADPFNVEPTFGDPGDDTHTKRRKKL